jgi:hypothetical protein
VPIFGINEAPGVSGGVMRTTYDRLRSTGMPDIGGVWEADGQPRNLEGWRKYWGVTGPLDVAEFPGEPAQGFRYTREEEGGFEFIRCETGALTRQIIDNDITYSMPEFIRFHVRDRASWEFYRQRRTPGKPWPQEMLDAAAKKYAGADQPVRISLHSTFGALRDIVGPEMACTIFYDDPSLAKDILDWLAWLNRDYLFPLIGAVKPDIVLISEDICYNHGMMISPAMFRQFCQPLYREALQAVRGCGAAMFAVDTDGFAEPFLPVVKEAGVNALFPWEVKSNNDLMRVRRDHPEFILMGGLEKECLNEGNARLIPGEMQKVNALLPLGRYFPNGDHGIQPLATFENLCRFMTLLHEACGNPEGDYPREVAL